MPRSVRKSNSSYVISVSLMTGCYRHIRLSADATLYELHHAIVDAFNFDDDHMHAFFMDNRMWSRTEAYCNDAVDDADHFSSEVTLGQLGLAVGRQFKYVYDFGDEWRFQCNVLKVLEESTDKTAVVRSVGIAPPQYGEPLDE